MALAFPDAKIVALDAGVEGTDNMLGISLTNQIAQDKNWTVSVEYGFSPNATESVIARHFGSESLDLVFIDGLHTNEQLSKDLEGVLPFCSKATMCLCHDILNWKLESAFENIKAALPHHDQHVLYRTTSGMGAYIAKDTPKDIKKIFHCFAEDMTRITELYRMDADRKLPYIVSLLLRPIKRIFRSWKKRIVRKVA